ncbi:MAG TPA: hypothetical protein PLI09_27325 [Candidatus Hydrogenedentes bacterium]|nr:hypothetical protein [Candidatus Hydrogenedentota bacterium]
MKYMVRMGLELGVAFVALTVFTQTKMKNKPKETKEGRSVCF